MITLKIKKIVVRGERMIKILDVKALTEGELPLRYVQIADLQNDAYAYMRSEYKQLYVARHQWAHTLYLGEVLTESKFTEIVKLLRKCGERLREINRQLAIDNAGWHGEETHHI